MKLEKEIASNKFENNYHKSVVNILYTYGWVTNVLRKRFDKYHITLQQFNILRILRGQHPEPATVNLLKERMLDKMSDASRIVERLVQKGLVSRCTNEKDRRSVDVLITQEGLDILKKLDSEMNVQDVLKHNLTEAEASQLSHLLDKLRG
ncbi:MarR family winged helix-turn-helix transcriptional regulator [Daejeonella oryzae]|uniref:MarR family winged helix-turn-helix transcriptional regulator n=1 Tax=Daejeonella oryzae TaxID=1122943 RepID=UPI000478F4AE|nr:MarR family transcriptional regulator [Daejeonella oryzae]